MCLGPPWTPDTPDPVTGCCAGVWECCPDMAGPGDVEGGQEREQASRRLTLASHSPSGPGPRQRTPCWAQAPGEVMCWFPTELSPCRQSPAPRQLAEELANRGEGSRLDRGCTSAWGRLLTSREPQVSTPTSLIWGGTCSFIPLWRLTEMRMEIWEHLTRVPCSFGSVSGGV